MTIPTVHLVWRENTFTCEHKKAGACATCTNNMANWIRHNNMMRFELMALLDDLTSNIYWDKRTIIGYNSAPIIRAIKKYRNMKDEMKEEE